MLQVTDKIIIETLKGPEVSAVQLRTAIDQVLGLELTSEQAICQEAGLPSLDFDLDQWGPIHENIRRSLLLLLTGNTSPTKKKLPLTPEQLDQWNGNIGLAFHFCRRFAGTMFYDDAVQDGALGLAEAIRRYDSGKGAKLSTYAAHAIRGAASKGISRQSSIFSAHPTIVKEVRRMQSGEDELGSELGRTPTAEEMAKHLGVTVLQYQLFRIYGERILSQHLDLYAKPLESADNGMWSIRLDETIGGQCELMQAFEKAHSVKNFRFILRMILHRNLSEPHLERKLEIFRERFGYSDRERLMDQEELGKKWGISRPSIQRNEYEIRDFLVKNTGFITMLRDLLDLPDLAVAPRVSFARRISEIGGQYIHEPKKPESTEGKEDILTYSKKLRIEKLSSPKTTAEELGIVFWSVLETMGMGSIHWLMTETCLNGRDIDKVLRGEDLPDGKQHALDRAKRLLIGLLWN